MKKTVAFILTVLFLFPGLALSEAPAVPSEPVVSAFELIERAVYLYGTYGAEENADVDEILDGLDSLYPETGARWRMIFDCWRRFDGMTFSARLPEGLPDDGSLCIVVLGYQLNPDGSMREELYKRLRVALYCAEQYPNAYILCTGGHTASENPGASEAGRMAKWLVKNGVAPERVIVEDSSLTTTQNADFTYAILTEDYPSVTVLAVISSDYHVASGAVLLEAASVLNAPSADLAPFRVAACAACAVRPGSSRSYAMSGLRSFARR